ncbi:peptidyl-dipeptidase Dcp [Granulicella tundricola]|uniref:Dipeptidyl carboxypeptidase n=1 Tax=Granulicella tundricola (strain ATCC BAA-1859 / DSM 23138 / MP5ACTX9) TaxID=1198114 RepID=E8X1W6_GRATM|nr:peptidyl-dipeptidase Dcp [Granulicella tundricola]ADW69127.1 Peptidyl-dipeptidase Dcp [Granulicella tundricola MP5ACTX9]
MSVVLAAGAMAVGMAQGQTAVFGPANPFYEKSSLPFEAPPFDRIKDADYEPALMAGMEAQTKEVRAIADNAVPATFENTVVALEKTGLLLDRVQAALGGVTGAYTNPTLEQLQAKMAPKMSAHEDAIYLDAKLFKRVEAVYEKRAGLGLDAESLRLLEHTYDGFVHSGAKLNDADKAKLKAMNEEESKLSNTFGRRLLAATKAGAYTTTDKAALAGLPEAQIAAAAAAAKARGVEGYVLPLQNTTQQPVLSGLNVRATREAVFHDSWTRAEKGGDNDTRMIVSELAQIRAQKAKLLGYPTYAAWKLENQMAKTPEAAIHFMDALVPAAVAEAKAEQRDIQELIDTQKGGFTVQPWDWEFYSEQVRKARYDIDPEAVRPYFEIDNVLQNGVFYAANKLYGVTFQERHDLPVYAPDVRVFEVFNADHSHLAIFYCDYWKRDNKRGGAWMGSFVRQSRLLGEMPVVYNVANFTKPADGQPALITFDDVTTMFHEFGHALHGMFAAAQYPSLSGTSVPRDFVEFPSQFNEHWSTYPDVFQHYAKDYKTGAPMPEELAAKLKRAATFNQGYALTELLAAAELDMQWHTLGAGMPAQEADAFEKAALEKKSLALEAVPPRYRSTYFSHVFAGGYAAGYYAYLWSEMLDDAAYHWFEENGGLTRANGDRFRKMVLSRGNTEDLAKMYDTWLGGEPKIEPMLKQRGLKQ